MKNKFNDQCLVILRSTGNCEEWRTGGRAGHIILCAAPSAVADHTAGLAETPLYEILCMLLTMYANMELSIWTCPLLYTRAKYPTCNIV